jgi:hypothetical protein
VNWRLASVLWTPLAQPQTPVPPKRRANAPLWPLVKPQPRLQPLLLQRPPAPKPPATHRLRLKRPPLKSRPLRW